MTQSETGANDALRGIFSNSQYSAQREEMKGGCCLSQHHNGDDSTADTEQADRKEEAEF